MQALLSLLLFLIAYLLIAYFIHSKLKRKGSLRLQRSFVALTLLSLLLALALLFSQAAAFSLTLITLLSSSLLIGLFMLFYQTCSQKIFILSVLAGIVLLTLALFKLVHTLEQM